MPTDPSTFRIAVSCGGTGGHVFPGLATAQALAERGRQVALWLSGKKVEAPSLAGWSGPVVSVPSEGFPSGFSLRSVRVTGSLLRAVWLCYRRMRRDPPDALLGMGSYSSVGPVLAARALRVPVVLHEANAVPGRAVLFLSRFADAVAIAFPEPRASSGTGRWPSRACPSARSPACASSRASWRRDA